MPGKLSIQTIKSKNLTEIYITVVSTLPLTGNTQNQELFCGIAEALRKILSWGPITPVIAAVCRDDQLFEIEVTAAGNIEK